MGGPATVTWRGAKFDPRTRDMLVELAARVPMYLQPTQGSYNTSVQASGGTHAGGGAVDLDVDGWSDQEIDLCVLQGRIVGFSMWHRQTWQGPWIEHIHGVANGCPDLSPAAAAQVVDYRNGRNGLKNKGPDDGPDVPYTTWEIYLESREDEMTPAQMAELKAHIDQRLGVSAAAMNVPRALLGPRGYYRIKNPASGKLTPITTVLWSIWYYVYNVFVRLVRVQEQQPVAPWTYKGVDEDRDTYAILRIIDRNTAAILALLDDDAATARQLLDAPAPAAAVLPDSADEAPVEPPADAVTEDDLEDAAGAA